MKKKVSLSDYCSYRIGGQAPFVSEPSSLYELQECLDFAAYQNLKVEVFGLGSNILFPDYPRSDTLYLTLRGLLNMKIKKNSIFFSAGIPLSLLAFFGILSQNRELAFTYLLPGTVGAGIFMNVKYGNFQISDFVRSVYYLDEKHKLCEISAKEAGFAYKTSVFQQKRMIIIGAKFNLGSLDKKGFDFLRLIIHQFKKHTRKFTDLPKFYDFFHHYKKKLARIRKLPKMFDEIETYRISKHHFEIPSCGSVFKNNYDFGRATGALVEELNLKGLTKGDAQIAPYHGNIIVNHGTASASDVISLIEEIQNRIQIKYGFTPEPEVQILE